MAGDSKQIQKRFTNENVFFWVFELTVGGLCAAGFFLRKDVEDITDDEVPDLMISMKLRTDDSSRLDNSMTRSQEPLIGNQNSSTEEISRKEILDKM